MPKKAGANFEDINQIRAGYAEGWSPEKISSFLNIDLDCVKSFNPEKPSEVTFEEKEDGNNSEYKDQAGGEQAEEGRSRRRARNRPG
jgi:hypothetical protein